MGMFDKDQLYGGTPLDQWVLPGTDFILHGVRVVTEEFPLDSTDKDGNKFATKCELFVAEMDSPDKVVKVSTLSGVIAQKVKEEASIADGTSGPEDSEFPAVCQFLMVESGQSGWSDAKTIQFVQPYTGDRATYNPDEVRDAEPISSKAPTGGSSKGKVSA